MDLTAGLDADALRRLVRETFGDRLSVSNVQRIRPWTVARCRLEGAPGPSTVIVKWLRSNPEGFRVDARQITTEAAALTTLAAVAPGVAPALLAHDLDHHVLLIEDLAPRRTLHSMLSTGLSPAGHAGLHAYAAAMGELHAATGNENPVGPWDLEARVPIGRRAAGELFDRFEQRVPAASNVRADLDAAVDAIEAPGVFMAFSNGDSGANNCLVAPDGGQARLIDFEHACARHALLDASALHVQGSMWMTVAAPEALGIEDTYRQAAGVGLPAVLNDDLFGFGLSAACALRALDKLLRFEKLDGRERGHHSRPQLVATIERTVQTMDRWRHLAALEAWLADVATALRRQWPDADMGFPNEYTLREPFDPDH